MKVDIISLFEQMAETGTAPRDGCHLFGVGYEGVFKSLKEKYLEERFSKGRAAEKFVVGPFGSGKTHFIRQLMEIARDLDCVTSEVQLSKDVDFTKNMLVYQEVAKEIRVSGHREGGILGLLSACIERVSDKAANKEELVLAWIEGVDKIEYRLPAFGHVIRIGLEAHLNNDEGRLYSAVRWLSGEMTDAGLARDLKVSKVTKQQEALHGKRATHSLFQFVHHTPFHGTVVAFDEAEQGFGIDKKNKDKIFSVLQSEINTIADLKDASALLIYAFTPDLLEDMHEFAALQQRVKDPGPGMSFNDGNVYAPVIRLTERDNADEELAHIGERLTDLLYDRAKVDIQTDRDAMRAAIQKLAHNVARDDESVSNRRTMIRRTCSMLLKGVKGTDLASSAATPKLPDEDEV